jgi:microcin C transport system substrate-binding protein
VLVNDAGQRLSFTLTNGYEALQDTLTILREEAAGRARAAPRVLDGTTAWKKVQEKQHDIQFTAFAVSPEMYPALLGDLSLGERLRRALAARWASTRIRRRKPSRRPTTCMVVALPELDRRIEAYRASDDVDEMKRLAFEMEEILHDDGSFVARLRHAVLPHGLLGLGEVAGRLQRQARQRAAQHQLFWIDETVRERVTQARRAGESLPPGGRVFDQYRTP